MKYSFRWGAFYIFGIAIIKNYCLLSFYQSYGVQPIVKIQALKSEKLYSSVHCTIKIFSNSKLLTSMDTEIQPKVKKLPRKKLNDVRASRRSFWLSRWTSEEVCYY